MCEHVVVLIELKHVVVVVFNTIYVVVVARSDVLC